jgi:hypothetical protein
MCGITGVVTQGPSPPSLDAVRRMVVLAHRGPEGNAVECVGACVLGNAQLAIIDLSERGRPPMGNEGGSIWISYSGEEYHARALPRKLDLQEKRAKRMKSLMRTTLLVTSGKSSNRDREVTAKESGSNPVQSPCYVEESQLCGNPNYCARHAPIC